jgi:adenylosuccinate synthase
VAYKYGGRTIKTLDFSGDARLLAQCEPVYENLPGWQINLRGCRAWKDLPKAAQDYIHFIEAQTGVPVKSISVGPERTAVIIRD